MRPSHLFLAIIALAIFSDCGLIRTIPAQESTEQPSTRKGVGTGLVQAFEAAIHTACDAYSLNVLKSNRPAMRFYEKLAFQCVGETAIAWKLRKELTAAANKT